MVRIEAFRGGERIMTVGLRSSRVRVGRSHRMDLALPDDSVSRAHCELRRRGSGGWEVVDLDSRHGVTVDGEAVEGPTPLSDGGRVGVGAVELVVHTGTTAQEQDATASRVVRPADHEALAELDDGQAVVRSAWIRVLTGPVEGTEERLTRSTVRVGGPGAHVVVHPDLPRDALILEVRAGRILLQPGTWAAFLDGARLQQPVPALDGDVVTVGDVELSLHSRVGTVGSDEEARPVGELVGSSAPMRRVYELLARVAQHDAPVLLVGESGTGKELAARAIHEAGMRRDGPFEAINAAALPPQLIESELFGHEPGAFTGASERADGAFQRAAGGTLFLDEIGECTLEVQAKLLRALATGEVRRVGGARAEVPDVRVVAATNRDLGAEVQAGRFRQDLLYRLAVLTVRMPALREHRDDLPEIAEALLQRDHPGARLTDGALDTLLDHPFPGNVRELRNVLTRAVVLGGPVVQADALSFQPWAFDPVAMDGAAVPATLRPEASDDEATRIRRALERSGGNRSEAARQLGIARTSLVYRIMKYGLEDVGRD